MKPYQISQEDIQRQNRNAIIGVVVSLVVITLLGLFISSLQVPKYTKVDVDDVCTSYYLQGAALCYQELAEKWIEEDGELIGGTYIKSLGHDFTSIKTGKRYIGGKERGEWICSKTTNEYGVRR